MDLQQLNELDFSNVGDWPVAAKAIVAALVFALVLGAWYYFDTQDQLQRIESAEQREVQLKRTFEAKWRKAANLDAYRRQLMEMKESFGAMLRQLPDKTEVPALLVDVSQTGLGAGLEFKLFKPLDETPKEFYAELPIRLRVVGRFHEFGDFVSGLASLPRIVTIHDISIHPLKSNQSGEGDLVMEATAKTYRYLEEGAK